MSRFYPVVLFLTALTAPSFRLELAQGRSRITRSSVSSYSISARVRRAIQGDRDPGHSIWRLVDEGMVESTGTSHGGGRLERGLYRSPRDPASSTPTRQPPRGRGQYGEDARPSWPPPVRIPGRVLKMGPNTTGRRGRCRRRWTLGKDHSKREPRGAAPSAPSLTAARSKGDDRVEDADWLSAQDSCLEVEYGCRRGETAASACPRDSLAVSRPLRHWL